jgi:Ser/Thr protein kinase RdoA (MazF antagonist)
MDRPAVDLRAPDPFNHGVLKPSWVPAEAEWAAALAREYGLPGLDGLWRLRRPEANSANFLLQSGGNRYVLRFWGIRDPLRLTHLEVLRGFAVDNGLPGPRSLVSRRDMVFAEQGGRLITMAPFVEGDYFRGDMGGLVAAATLQASFHAATGHFPLASTLGQGAPHAEEGAPPEAAEQARTGQGAFDREAAAALEECDCWPDVPPDLQALPRQTCHLDWNPQNLLFRPGTPEVTALLDYDFAAVAERALDVALGMHKFARVFGPKTEAGEGEGADMRDRCRAYLESYSAVAKAAGAPSLSREEIDAIPYLIFSQARRNILFILRRHYQEGDGMSDYDLPKQRVLLREALALRDMG